MSQRYCVFFSKPAQRKLNRLSKTEQKKVARTILALENDPLAKSLNIKKLKGKHNKSWRIRLGDIRLLYTLDPKKKIILIFKIDFRGQVYNY